MQDEDKSASAKPAEPAAPAKPRPEHTTETTRPMVYLAGPIGKGDDMLKNVLIAIDWADRLTDFGAVIEIPHLTYYWHIRRPREYEHWMDVDFEIIKRCDALFRIPGHSPGVDREVAFAKRLGKDVFYADDADDKALELFRFYVSSFIGDRRYLRFADLRRWIIDASEDWSFNDLEYAVRNVQSEVYAPCHRCRNSNTMTDSSGRPTLCLSMCLCSCHAEKKNRIRETPRMHARG